MSSSGILIAGVFIKYISKKKNNQTTKAGGSRGWCCRGSGYFNKLLVLLSCCTDWQKQHWQKEQQNQDNCGAITNVWHKKKRKRIASKLNCKCLKITAGLETAPRVKQFYKIHWVFFIPPFGVRGPLGCVQGFFWTPGAGGAGLSSVAKPGGTGGVTGGGLSLSNFYAKTKKKARLIYMECLVLVGLQLSLGKRKAKPTFAHLDVCRASFEVECCITMPLFPVVGLGGGSALVCVVFQGFFFSVCRISFAGRDNSIYAASMMCRVG